MQDILIQAVCYVSIIILGYTLRKCGFFGEEAFPVLASIALKITLPAAIIASANGKTIDAAMLLLPALGFGCGVLYILAAIALHRHASKEQRAFAILNLPGYSIGSFAMPFTQGFLGPVAVLATSLFDIGNAFICLGTTLAIAIAVKAGEGFQWKRLFQSLSRSVAFLTYVVMTLLALVGWQLPSPVISFARIIGNANPFLSMLMIGVGFKLTLDPGKIGTMARILLCRYGMAAIFACIFYFALPFALEIRQALVILAFSPIGASVPGFTAELKEDVGLSSAINSLSIVCSVTIIVTLLLVML